MKDRPTLTELRVLSAVAMHRSFRKAADELELARSTAPALDLMAP
jgi:DNA-binding transcriptional LysR family regulator